MFKVTKSQVRAQKNTYKEHNVCSYYMLNNLTGEIIYSTFISFSCILPFSFMAFSDFIINCAKDKINTNENYSSVLCVQQ